MEVASPLLPPPPVVNGHQRTFAEMAGLLTLWGWCCESPALPGRVGLQSSGWAAPPSPESPAAQSARSRTAAHLPQVTSGRKRGSPHHTEGSLGICWRTRACPTFTQHPSRFSCLHSLGPSFRFPHEFLWSLLREGGNFKVERRVGVELIRKRDSTVKAQTFQRSGFYFPMASCSFWDVPERTCHGIPKQASCSDDVR